ncbi:uncharacterized protein LOC128093054 [Culex pipiens pallens]|uniref:uncharacterized protein LOC128093054 n=1 Tax=Culex pipiens pallens TaxID=42434 RepID=UPI0022AAD03D|nr:uncharacterized protein LOC128093054 [Culex pipiens pallens]
MESALASIKLDVEHCSKAFDFVKFPENVLDQIFQYLTVKQLLTIRSTCRSWKKIFDGSSAMNRIVLEFPENLVLDRKYSPPSLVPARNLCFSKSRISAVDSWWPSVGERLIYLSVNDCQISYAMLLKMLRQCPNLNSLEYLCPAYPAASVSIGDMKFDKLEHLKIENSAIFYILYDIVKMCPNLKDLNMVQEINAMELIKHVGVLKDILAEINIVGVSKVINEMQQFKQLKHLHIENEVLSDQTLRAIAAIHPRLETITVNITSTGTVEVTFLEVLECLQTLSIKSNIVNHRGYVCSNQTSVNFTALNGKKLKKLELVRIRPTHLSLQRLLKESSNLQEIVLDTCHFQDWSEIFSLAEKQKMLKRLELNSVIVQNDNCCLSEYFDNLKYLKLINCNLPKQRLETFFSLCSELEGVVLQSIQSVDDDVILELLQSSDRLKKLTLNICPSVTDVSVDHIATYGLMLKQLTITSCQGVSDDALKNLNVASN